MPRYCSHILSLKVRTRHLLAQAQRILRIMARSGTARLPLARSRRVLRRVTEARGRALRRVAYAFDCVAGGVGHLQRALASLDIRVRGI